MSHVKLKDSHTKGTRPLPRTHPSEDISLLDAEEAVLGGILSGKLATRMLEHGTQLSRCIYVFRALY